MTFYQACYGKPGNNWQLLNLSKDTPPHMVSFFESIGNSCTPQSIGSDTLLDKDGNQIVLYELVSAENTICVLRAKYGERDSFGRPKMFAHGFMFPAEGSYREPAELLSIADSNFNFSDESTLNIPTQLSKDDKLSLEEAISICKMDSDSSKWKQLMKCVYAMLSSSVDYPLYIRCNGDLNTIKASIMCILSALPYSLRYQLSFANADSLSYAKFKRIMFVETLPQYSYFFDLESGDTNLTSEISEIDQYPEKYAAFCAFIRMPSDEFKRYCDSIQYILETLSFGYAADIDETNLAHLFLESVESLDALNDSELMKRLLELLVKAPMKNSFADDYIAKVLNKFNERGLLPTETIFKRIELRFDKTSSGAFVNIYKKIRMRVLLSKGSADMVSFLSGQYTKSKSNFGEYVQIVQSIPNGKEVIELFFKGKTEECQSYEEVIRINEDILCYSCASRETKQVVYIRLREIAIGHFINTPILHANYKHEFELLKNDLKQIYGSNSNKIFDIISKDAVSTFWSKFDYSDLEFKKKYFDNCLSMKPADFKDSMALRKFSDVSLLSNIYGAVRNYKETSGSSNYWEIEQEVSEFDQKKDLDTPEAKIVLQKLEDFLCKSLYSTEGSRHFCMWLKIIQLGEGEGFNPISSFINWELPVICDPDCFESSFRESERMREKGNTIKRWLSEAINEPAYYQISTESIKILKRDIKAIDDYRKEIAADERRRLKEQQKEEKKSAQISSDYTLPDALSSQKAPKSKKSLFGGLFGGKKG